MDRFAEGKGYLPLLTSDLESGEFRVLPEGSFDLGKTKKRHGGVLPITADECSRLLAAFGDGHQVLPGQFADPDLVKFGDRYYLYPTTDGFTGWSGTQFHAFSSADMRIWKDEGVILDFATEDVPWAVGSAWAPAIASKDGKYYYYFCGKMESGESAIGVAVAETPAGPFRAQPLPLITMEQMKRLDIAMGQTIDPSVFIEDDGTAYMLFGNAYPAIVQLGDDMVSVIEDTMKIFRPARLPGGGHRSQAWWAVSLHVVLRRHRQRGLPRELWHGGASLRAGNLPLPSISKTRRRICSAPAHHSILQEPGTDKYWIAYHRFVTPLTRFTQGKGYHREVCIDPLSFGEDGLMQQVQL